MTTHYRQTALLGELVLAAFDEAARYSMNPHEVSRLATRAVAHMLQRARKIPTLHSPPTIRTKAAASLH